MYAPKYRLEAIETIGRKILLEYDRTLLEGPPQAKMGASLEKPFLMTEQPFYMTEQRGNTV